MCDLCLSSTGWDDGCRLLLCATSGQLESGTHTVNISDLTHNVSSVQPPAGNGLSPNGPGASASSTAALEEFDVIQIFGKPQTAGESYGPYLELN